MFRDVTAVDIETRSMGGTRSLVIGNRMLMARTFLFLLLIVSLSACSKQEQKVEHRVPTEDPLTSALNAQYTGAEGQEAVQIFNAKFGLTKLDRESSSMLFGLGDPFENRVKPMAEVLLVEDLYSHTEIQNLTAERVFSRFHSAMVDALGMEDQREEVLAFVNNYVDNYVLVGCDAQLKDCRYKDFYRRVRYTKELLLARIRYAEGDRCKASTLDENYRLIKMAYGYTVGVDDPKTDAYFIECANPYVQKLYAKETELRALATGDPRKAELADLETEVRDFGEKLAQIISRSDRILADEGLKKSYDRFYGEVKPLRYNSSSRPTEVTLNVLQDVRYAILLEDAKLGKLNDPKYLSDLDATEGSQSDEYAYEQMRTYLAEKSAKMLAALGMEMTTDRSAYLVILEKIATQQWDARLATKFFDNLRSKNREKLEKMIEHYVRIMMLRQIAESNEEMGNFFNNIDFSTREMLTKVSDKALTLQKNWVEFHDAVKVVRDFTVAALNIPYDELSKVGIDVDGLVDATNYMVVLPHMMLMAYKMYERRFSMEFRTWFGTVKIKYTDVFNYFFSSGTMAYWGVQPWFDYSPGLSMNGWGRRYNTAAMINAFYFALRTGAFDLYQVKPEDFLKGTMDTLLADHQVLVKEMYEEHANIRETKAVVYEETKYFCEQERIRRDRQKTGQPYIAGYRYEVDFTDLDLGILSTLPFMEELTGENASRFMKSTQNDLVGHRFNSLAWFQHDKQEMFDLIRLGGGYWEHYLGAMRGIYKEYKKDLVKIETGATDLTADQLAAIESNVQTFDRSLRQYKHDQRRLFTLMRKSFEETMLDCTLLATQRELDLFHLLYMKEMDYLRDVYRQFVASVQLPEGEERNAALAQLNAKLSSDVAEPEYEYEGRTYVDNTHLHYARLDLYMRLRRFIPEVTPEVAVKMPERKETFYKTGLYQKSQLSAEIAFYDETGDLHSEEKFIRLAMAYWGPRPLTSSGDMYITWASHFSTFWGGSQIAKKFVPGIAAFYMLGEVEMYEDQDNARCLTRFIPSEEVCPRKKAYLTSVEDLQRENIAVADLVSVREDQEQIYRDMGLSMFLDNGFVYYTGFSPTLYDSRTSGVITEPDKIVELGLLDMSYLLVAYSEFLGMRPNYPWEENDVQNGGGGRDDYDPKRITAWQQLAIYKESREKFDYLLFKVKPETTEVVDGIFKSFYDQNKDLVLGFERAADALAEEDASRAAAGETWVGLDGNVYPFRRSVRISLNRDRVYDQYITPTYLDEFRLKLRNFNQTTEFFYDPDADPRASGE